MSEAAGCGGPTRRFRIQWKRQPGSDKWYVYTFIAARPIRSVKDKIRALTRRTSQVNPQDVLIRLNQIVHGWANYFRHAVAKHTFRMLGKFLWHRVIMWLKTLHRWSWKDVRAQFQGPHGSWLPIAADGTELINLARTPAITRYRYRGDTIPTPWTTA